MTVLKRSAIAKNCLLLTMALLCTLMVRGQDLSAQVVCAFMEDSVQVQLGQTFSNALILENRSGQKLHLLRHGKDVGFALIDLPDSLELNPGERRKIYVKYLASPAFIRRSGRRVEALYAAKGELITAAFGLIIPNVDGLQLSSISENYFLDEQTGTVPLTLLCNNNGYKPLSFDLQIRSYPEGLININKSMSVALPSGVQTKKTILLKNALGKNMTQDYMITIIAVDREGNQLASITSKIIQLSSSKQVTLPSGVSSSLIDNTVRLSYWNSGSRLNYFQLSAIGQLGMANTDLLNYSLNLNHYTKPFSGREMFDSYLNYKGKKWAFKVGSIGANLDFPVYGQGVEASVKLNSKNTLSALYVKNNYLLFSDIYDQLPGADIWAMHYDFHNHGQHFGGANLIYSTDPVTGVQTEFVNGDLRLITKGNEFLNVEFGLSNESLPDSADHLNRSGVAVSGHYGNQWGRWSFYSDNYFSSAYYSGLSRGSILLDERLSYQINDKWNNYVAFTKTDNKPKYLNNIYIRGGIYNTANTYSYNLTWRSHAFSLSFRPYYFVQQLAQDFAVHSSDIESKSIRGEMTALFQFPHQQLMVVTDIGKVKSDNIYLHKNQYVSWKTNAVFSSKHIGFQVLLQNNPFYILEEPNVWQKGMFNRYSFGPNVQFTALNNRINIYASDYANNLSYTGSWYNSFQMQASWMPARTWRLEAAANINSYFYNGNNHYLQTRISLEKRFVQMNTPGYHKLSVKFFGDRNGNGFQDEDEEPLLGVIASLDEISAVSNGKGRIVFTNLSAQKYTLKVIDGKAWSLIQPIEVILNKNQQKDIALVKNVLVTGRIEGIKSPYIKQRINVEGIKVIATGRKLNFSTLSNADGDFSFYLPIGHYTFTVETEGLNFEAETTSQELDVTGGPTPSVLFRLTDHSRKVDVKDF